MRLNALKISSGAGHNKLGSLTDLLILSITSFNKLRLFLTNKSLKGSDTSSRDFFKSSLLKANMLDNLLIYNFI